MKKIIYVVLIGILFTSCLTSNFELLGKEKVNTNLLGNWKENDKVFTISKKNDTDYILTVEGSNKEIEFFSVEIKGHHIFNIKQKDEKIKNIFFRYIIEDNKLTFYDISDKYRGDNGLKDFKSQKDLMKYIKKNIDKEDFFSDPEVLEKV